MEFNQFRQQFDKHVTKMMRRATALHVTNVDPDEMWNLYLDSFPPGTNEIYRERRAHDCSCCRAFIRQFGAVVSIVNTELVSIWDFDAQSDTYQPVIDALSAYVKSRRIRDMFMTKDTKFGTDKSRELREDHVHVWQHFYLELPDHLVSRSHRTMDSVRATARTNMEVLKRSLYEISAYAVKTVLELIEEDNLYRGEPWREPLEKLLDISNRVHALDAAHRDIFIWETAAQVTESISRIKNHSIGTLLMDLTEGVDPLEAVRRYERIVAPENYKRPKPLFTKRMLEEAQATIERLGLTDSLPRRFARLTDITVNNVLWANRDAVQAMSGSPFDVLAQDITVDPRKYERTPGMAIETFVSSVLPDATSVEVLLENQHQSNMVSLIAPQNPEAPTLFKWDNNFGWAFGGNLASSSMKQRVKALGGDVFGVLRFSIQWNEHNENKNDFDAHAVEPSGRHIYFRNKAQRHPSSGMLDVDIINPGRDPAVENITWTNLERMPTGIYHLYVHNFSHNGGKTGFRAEIEFKGEVHEYSYPHELRQGEIVTVAEVRLNADGTIEFLEGLESSTAAKKVWGLMTNQFHPVSVICLSPNYWDRNNVGLKHYFFMLSGCVNPENPSGFYNEYLKEALMEQKRVFAALSNRMRVEDDDAQLSGLGFNTTSQASVIARVDHGRLIKVVI